MLADLIPVLTLLLLAGAQPRPCTREEAMAAEESTHLARRSWGELHDQYAKRAACDDAAIAEGWSGAAAAPSPTRTIATPFTSSATARK
jgi:hypothetical protein